MDVHREGGRREDGDGDVAEAAAGSTMAMRMTTPRVDEEGHTDASNHNSLLFSLNHWDVGVVRNQFSCHVVVVIT